MKKTSVILVVILLALVIVAAIAVVPFVMSVTAIGEYVVNMSGDYNTYYEDITNNEYISDAVKDDVIAMRKISMDSASTMAKSYFTTIAYLVVAISVILIAVGIYFIKNPNCKNYVGTALIVAACILLAFSAIIGMYVIKL